MYTVNLNSIASIDAMRLDPFAYRLLPMRLPKGILNRSQARRCYATGESHLTCDTLYLWVYSAERLSRTQVRGADE